MKTKNNVEKAFEAARRAELCFNQSQFAAILGTDRATISRAINGEPSEKLELKVENFLRSHNLSIGDGNQIAGTGNTQVNAAPAEAQQQPQQQATPTADKLLDEMKAQREMYDRQLTELLRQNSQLIKIITDSK